MAEQTSAPTAKGRKRVPLRIRAVGLTASGLALAALTTPAAAATSGQVSGTVASVDAGAHTFAVKTASGTTTVKVTAATAYHDSLVKAPNFADIKVGDSVVAIGTTAKGVETATVVIIGGSGSGSGTPGAPPGGGFGGFGGGTAGTVTAVNAGAGTFVVKTRTGSSVTVTVTKSTTFRDRSGSTPSLADVKVGTTVFVLGTTTKGKETATSVIIGGFGGAGGFAGRGIHNGTFGTVASLNTKADTFVVKTAAGTKVTVKVTKKTTYRDPGATKASFSTLKVGASVVVTGTTKKGVETATSVAVGFGRPPASSTSTA